MAASKTHKNDMSTLLFAELKHAKERCDFERAAELTRELRTMGIVVKFSDPRPPRTEAAPCN